MEGFRERGTGRQCVVLTGVVELGSDLGGPESLENLHLFDEAFKTFLERREGYSVRTVLGLEPPGADAHLDSTLAHRVHLGDGDGERAGESEGRGGEQRTEAHPGGLTSETGEGDPGVGGTGQSAHFAHLEVVIGTKECSKVGFFG